MSINSVSARTFQAGRGTMSTCYVATFNGFARVTHFRSDWWAVCPDENAGFGLSFCCGPDTRVYPQAALVEVFGSMSEANAAIAAAGGHMASALRRYEAAEPHPTDVLHQQAEDARPYGSDEQES